MAAGGDLASGQDQAVQGPVCPCWLGPALCSKDTWPGFKMALSLQVPFGFPPPFLPGSRFAGSKVGPLGSKPLSQSLWLFPLHCLCGSPSPQGLSGLFWPRSCPVAGASRLQPDCPRDALCRVVWAAPSQGSACPTPWWLEESRGYPTATVGLLPAGRAGRKQTGVGTTGNIFVPCWSE